MSATYPFYPILLSILAALVTLGLKGAAYLLTDSVGLLSDAAESLVNLVAALTALGCQWYASQPVDTTHTYGHEKIEFFSSGLEGMLILVAAGGIAWYALQRLFQPQTLQPLDLGVFLCFAASLINLTVARILIGAGRRARSILLEADGQHLMTDVWTSFGVIVGLVLVRFTGWVILDPVLALIMAGNIVWTAWDLLARSFNGLMDHALPERDQTAVRAAIEALLQPGSHYHALRTRQAGSRKFVDFHLLVPGQWSVQQAHDFAERVEEAVCAVLPGTEVAIHIEPIEAESAWKDSALLTLETPTARMEREFPFYKAPSMIHVIATVEVKPGQREAFLAEFHRIVPLVHAETGCLEYGPTVDVASGIGAQGAIRDDVAVIIEKWSNMEALRAHLQASHMAEYRARVKDMVAGVQLQVLSPATGPTR